MPTQQNQQCIAKISGRLCASGGSAPLLHPAWTGPGLPPLPLCPISGSGVEMGGAGRWLQSLHLTQCLGVLCGEAGARARRLAAGTHVSWVSSVSLG